MAVLSVNAGSSSLKFAVYPVADQAVGAALLVGNFEGLEPGGQARLSYSHQGTRHEAQLQATAGQDPFDAALARLQTLLTQELSLPALRAVAHRVVHGGEAFVQPVRVTPEVLAQLRRYNSLAPLHQPHNLAGIEAFARAFADLPQIACFDTAFHASVPALHSAFALPQALRVIIPPMTSQYLNLAKNSSLAVAIGYPDLVAIANTTMNQTGQAIEAIAILMAVYLSISLAISLFMNWYNDRVRLVER